MHAEVILLFADDCRESWLTRGLPAASDPQSVISLTRLRGSADVLSTTLYARLETAFVYLLLRENSRAVKIYVEGREYKGDLRQLARRSEQLGDAFIRSGESHGIRFDSATINLYADESLITSGVKRRFTERLLRRFSETIFGDVMVGLFTGVLTVTITGARSAALVAAVASVLCFLVWLAIEISGGRDAYEYTGF